jgi:hypothetical protein
MSNSGDKRRSIGSRSVFLKKAIRKRLSYGSASQAASTVYTDWFFGTPVTSVNANLSVTLGDVALSSTATVGVAGVTATFSQTLGEMTLSSTAKLPILASLTVTLGTLTLSSSASLPIKGNLAVTLGSISLVSEAKLPIKGSLSATLDPVSLSSSASVGVAGVNANLSATLGELTLSSTAHVEGGGQVIVGGGITHDEAARQWERNAKSSIKLIEEALKRQEIKPQEPEGIEKTAEELPAVFVREALPPAEPISMLMAQAQEYGRAYDFLIAALVSRDLQRIAEEARALEVAVIDAIDDEAIEAMMLIVAMDD